MHVEWGQPPHRAAAAKAIYGLVTVLAVLVTMEDHPPVAWRGAITLFGATLAVALVDTYSETIAGMLSSQRRLSRDELREIWRDVSPVLVGAQAPTLILLVSAIGLFSVERAITIAEVVAFCCSSAAAGASAGSCTSTGFASCSAASSASPSAG